MDLEDLNHKPVFDLATELFVGYIVGTVVNEDRTEMLGILVRSRFGRPKMLAPISSVALVHDEGVMIEKSGYRWLPLCWKIWRAWRRQRRSGMLRAEHQGELVGNVVDYRASKDGRITHLVIQRGMMGKTLKVRRDNVVAFEEGTFVLAAGVLDESKAKPKKKAEASDSVVDAAAVLLGKSLARASGRVKSGARSSLLGKPAPWPIRDREGRVALAEGKALTEEALALEAARGKTAELAAAVAAGSLGRSVAKRRKKRAQTT